MICCRKDRSGHRGSRRCPNGIRSEIWGRANWTNVPALLGGGRVLLLEPALKHQDRPNGSCRIAAATEMLMPASADDACLEPTLPGEPPLVQKLLRPISERPAQPIANRNSEPGLGPIEKLARSFAVEELADDALALAIRDL